MTPLIPEIKGSVRNPAPASEVRGHHQGRLALPQLIQAS